MENTNVKVGSSSSTRHLSEGMLELCNAMDIFAPLGLINFNIDNKYFLHINSYRYGVSSITCVGRVEDFKYRVFGSYKETLDTKSMEQMCFYMNKLVLKTQIVVKRHTLYFFPKHLSGLMFWLTILGFSDIL